MARSRLDAALVERGLVQTRTRAQAAVASGRVRINGHVADRPATPVEPEDTLLVEAAPEFVSRGGEKLSGALADFGLDVTGARALDLGASTGGFTDCLLQRGAAHVTAVDVGYGQLAWTLRNDPRVTVLERTNARNLTAAAVSPPADFVTCDLAFISVVTVWPAAVRCLTRDHRALILVKPQFEVGKGKVPQGGVVRDPLLHAEAIHKVAAAITAQGGRIRAIAPSRLIGPKGNREFFILSEGADTEAQPRIDLEHAVNEAVRNAP
jgi:23S rRNA (cytidine1920-2'-O)/16S rRNA (cytidine1409-2'-O)-methyltransferase